MATTLDFSALISRNHRPSRIAQIAPRSALEPPKKKREGGVGTATAAGAGAGDGGAAGHSDVGRQRPVRVEEDKDVVYYLVDDEDGDTDGEARATDDGGREDGDEDDSQVTHLADDRRWKHLLQSDIEQSREASERAKAKRLALQKLREEKRRRTRDECDDLARTLVRQTPYYKSQSRAEEDEEDGEEEKKEEDDKAAITSIENCYAKMREQHMLRIGKHAQERNLPPSFHGIEQSDWESRIEWGEHDNDGGGRRRTNNRTDEKGPIHVDPHEVLNQGYNPALDAMDCSALVSWEGADAPPGYNAALANSLPLILQGGVAGTSVARLAIPPRRPIPLSRSDVYIRRMEKEMNSTASSTAGVIPSNTLDPNSGKMAEEIAKRMKKRALMAIDKSKRVTEAMGTMDLGGGKGRAITSSLMGPGGTERTGRPTKHMGSSSAYDAELVEHLDLVYNHTLVRPDLKRSELRQFHRPRLPRSVVRKNRTWQLQVRLTSSTAGKGGGSTRSQTTGDGSSTVSTHVMMGTHPGAISQAKIRNEADLSPAEGDLVLLEYCEERPPVQLSKGMASKIINFYRGDKAKCPISAGGGARPPRKRTGQKATTSTEKLEKPRLVGPTAFDTTKINDLIGVKKKKKKDDGAGEAEDAAGGDKKKESSTVEVLPEGVTEILPPKLHGPFIGAIDEGTTQSGLISNLFAAPIFQQEPEQSDFLMILGKKPSHRHHHRGEPDSFGVVLRQLPKSVYCVGQTEPKVKVFAAHTTGEKAFTAPFITYQIAKHLTRTEAKDGRGLRFDEINDRLFANTALLPNALRQRIKQVAIYDKNTQIWTSKKIGFEDYPGVEALGRRFSPEGVAAYESACAYGLRLHDLGMTDLYSGSSSVTSVGQAMLYVNGAVNAARERKSKMTKMAEFARNSKSKERAGQTALYEEAAAILEAAWKEMRRRQEVARFIYEELQLAPWNLTQEFIDIHKNAQGTAMMRLTGMGDPSGRGEGYSYLREVDTKPNKLTGNTDGALNAQIKKITGTENDLRKLTMKQMASLLRSYGMGQKQIDSLKRWDRVHCIRDLSTKAASDGMGDGLERYARGEKMKLSDQKQMYRDRMQEIWKRQRAALSTDAGAFDAAAKGSGRPGDGDAAAAGSATADPGAKNEQKEEGSDDSDSESDDDFAAALEEDMMDVRETNLLVADHVRRGAGSADDIIGPVGGLAHAGDTQEMSKDARELAALKRQREEERLAQEGLLSKAGRPDGQDLGKKAELANRKVVRKRVTKTLPDGSQTTTFEFIVRPDEVEKVITKKKEEAKAAREGRREQGGEKKGDRKKKGHTKPKSPAKAKNDWVQSGELVGHAMFEEEDDTADHRISKPNIKLQLHRSTKIITKKTKKANRVIKAPPKPPKPPKLLKKPKVQLGKLKQKLKQEKRVKKRQREEDEAELYSSAPHRKGTSNRRERGAARHRMPHVIFSNRLEDIRAEVERRPNSGPFHRPVDRRLIPRYYEVISEPIDLQTIRDKNQRYEYRTVDGFVRDFELMKNNAIKFNGLASLLGNEATAMYEHVKNTAESNREEFTRMEEAVRDQLSDSGRKKLKTSAANDDTSAANDGGSSTAGSAVGTTDVRVDGVANLINLDLANIPTNFSFDAGDDSDSDDSAIPAAGV